MRNQIFKGIATFGLFLTLGVACVQAQTRYRIEVNIPFDFTAGQSSFRAGTYSVKLISRNALLLRSIDGKKSVLVLAPRAIESERLEKPERIIFNRYGARYFLSQVWLSRADSGRELDPSSAERRLAKEHPLTNGDAKPQKVEVAVK